MANNGFRMPNASDPPFTKSVINSRQYMQMTPGRDLYPAGYFNEHKRERDGAGPTGTLLTKAQRANNMRDGINRNLIHTQLAARVNVTRYILPLKLPGVFAFPDMLEVRKTFVSGDVMFALRYTSAMFEQGIATDITRKPPPLHMTGVNLPTLNYILVNYQLLLWDHINKFYEEDGNPNYKKSLQNWKNYFSSLYVGLLERNNFMTNSLDEFKRDVNACGGDILAKNVLMQVHVWKFMRNFVRVAGVFIGSEEQGGQNQGAANPASHNPIDFMAAMQISGKFENVRNLWTTSGSDVSNGDTLGFTLACIIPREQTTLRMQLSGNAVTHRQVTFDFSTLNNALLEENQGARIWILVPAIQNRLKHGIGLADTNVVTEDMIANMQNEQARFDTYALGSNLKGEFFMQFGIVNQMSKGVAGSMRASDYAKDATACTVPTNSEVLLRFTVGDPSVEREYTEEDVLDFVREMTGADSQRKVNEKVAELGTMSAKTSANLMQQTNSARAITADTFWKDRAKKSNDGSTVSAILFSLVQKFPKAGLGSMRVQEVKSEGQQTSVLDPQKKTSNVVPDDGFRVADVKNAIDVVPDPPRTIPARVPKPRVPSKPAAPTPAAGVGAEDKTPLP